MTSPAEIIVFVAGVIRVEEFHPQARPHRLNQVKLGPDAEHRSAGVRTRPLERDETHVARSTNDTEHQRGQAANTHKNAHELGRNRSSDE